MGALTEPSSPQQLDVNNFTLTIPLQGRPVSFKEELTETESK